MANQKYRYKVDGKYVNLVVDMDYIAVNFKEPAPMSIRESVISNMDAVGDFSSRIEIPNEKFTVFKVAENQEERVSRLTRAENSLNDNEAVDKIRPIFKYRNQHLMATEKITVGFKSIENLHQFVERYNLKKVNNYDNDYIFEVPNSVDVFDYVEQIEKEDNINFVEPNFAIFSGQDIISKKNSVETLIRPFDNQDLSGQQYALSKIQAFDAWTVQTGNPTIKIAIIDEGVDTTHPNYRNKVVGNFDALDNDTFQEPNSWDGHGTACTGLAAAEHQTSGIKGVAGGSSIMAIRIASKDEPQGIWHTSTDKIRHGIEWAWGNGADVLSNSWGGGAPNSSISNAIDRARRLGRGGKGCIVIFAAGNDDGDVSFPATLDFVLTVSASNQYDEPKTKFSTDGERWGSNHGPQVDIAAPGVANLTTDIVGAGGYNPGDYYALFNGTSSATPIVAGVAALILSVNPDLTEAQVREILTNTTDKVGNIPYFNGHNDRMGFGRVNAFKAVLAAKKLVTA